MAQNGTAFSGGTLTCGVNCKVITTGCTYCGDGKVGGSEACDCPSGTCTAGQTTKTCTQLTSPAGMPYSGGTVGCSSTCEPNPATCTYCGDGVKNGQEPCDGTDLGGTTCADRGFAGGGTLQCSSACLFDSSLCTGGVSGTIVIACDDVYELFVNGRSIGTSSGVDAWKKSQTYTLDFAPGPNVVAIHGTNSDNTGACFVDVRVGAFVAASGTAWKASTTGPTGWNTLGFDDTAWAAATAYGPLATFPWTCCGGPPQFPSGTTGQWMWTGQAADEDTYLRLVFSP